MFRKLAITSIAALALAACSDDSITSPDASLDAAFAKFGHAGGAVYVQTNSAAGNAVLVFNRAADGSLSAPQSFATGGTGTGAGLGSQGAVTLTEDGQWLLAVNAGSDGVSLFRVTDAGLELADVAPSGGDMPISVTVNGSLVYTVNAGGVNNISGLRLSDGELTPIAGSTRPLSAASAGPAQVEFTPDGDRLVVTEKATNMITTYDVSSAGLASAPQPHPSSGATPFGFAFGKNNLLVVSEAFGGAANASATSSYDLKHDAFALITGSAPTTETAACWTAIDRKSNFAYVANTGSGTVTGYAISNQGSLTLLDADGRTGVTGPGTAPADLDFDASGQFLYVRNGGTGSISVFSMNRDGSLNTLTGIAGIPANSAGLIAR
jgi:6-phosphogluconolactonase